MKVVQTAQRWPFLFLQATLRSQLRADGGWACPAVHPPEPPSSIILFISNASTEKINNSEYTCSFQSQVSDGVDMVHPVAPALRSHKCRSLEKDGGRVGSWAGFSAPSHFKWSSHFLQLPAWEILHMHQTTKSSLLLPPKIVKKFLMSEVNISYFILNAWFPTFHTRGKQSVSLFAAAFSILKEHCCIVLFLPLLCFTLTSPCLLIFLHRSY